MLEASRGTAYGLGLSQCAITLGILLFFPAVDVDVFVARADLAGNHSAIALTPTAVRANMAMPVAAASLLAGVFATVTYKVDEQSLSGQDFQPDVIDQMGMWDALFWMYCLVAHAIVVLMVCDPVDAFGAVSATAFMVYFLFRACYPKSQQINLTQENLNILGYGLGVLQVALQVTSTRANGVSALMAMVVMDYFLGVGHTYDREATVGTVSNCRVFYICAGTVGTAVLYAMSGAGNESGRAVM